MIISATLLFENQPAWLSGITGTSDSGIPLSNVLAVVCEGRPLTKMKTEATKLMLYNISQYGHLVP